MLCRKQSFSGRVVAITGGASGIGLALGRAFLQRGAAVALLDIEGDAAAARARELGQSALGIGCDVTSEADCQAAIAAVIDRFGGIDVLVNNAGITQREAFTRTDVAAIRKVMEVNFFGAVNCTKAAQESLIERRGTIIVTSSIAGVAPLLGRAGYSASKHALHGLFGTIRAELRPLGVEVLIVCPSFVDTNLQSRALGGDGEVTEHPQSTVGAVETPEQVAETILDAAERRRNLLVMSPVGNVSRWLSNLAPGLYDRIMSRKLRGEIER